MPAFIVKFQRYAKILMIIIGYEPDQRDLLSDEAVNGERQMVCPRRTQLHHSIGEAIALYQRVPGRGIGRLQRWREIDDDVPTWSAPLLCLRLVKHWQRDHFMRF